MPALAWFLAVPAAAQTPEEAGRRLESLELTAIGSAVELEVISTGEIELVGVQIDSQGRLILQFPLHDRGPGAQDRFPETGLISAIQVDSQPTARGPLTRLAITTRRPAEHSVSSRGQRLRLRLWPRDELPPEAAEVTSLRGQVMEMRSSLTQSERLRDELAGRLQSLAADNRELARKFQDLKRRRSGLDAELKGTLGELTQMVRQLETERAELAERLEAAGGEREALAAQVSTLEARGGQLETDLEARRAEIERLEQEGAALAAELDLRLAEAAARESELRTQLETAENLLVESLEGAAASARDLQAQLETVEDALVESRMESSTPRAFPAPDMAAIETAPAAGSPPRDARDSETEELLAALEIARGEITRIRETARVHEQQLVSRRQTLEQTRSQLQSDLSAARAAGEGTDRERVVVGQTTAGVNLRSEPDIRSHRFTVLPEGSSVEVLDRGETWIQVRAGEHEGWVHGDYLELEGEESGELEAALEAARAEIEERRQRMRAGGASGSSSSGSVAQVAEISGAEEVSAGGDGAGEFPRQLLAGARVSIERSPGYDASYRRMPYPGGDPGWERGTGADLIVRAFRHAGMDLQVEVHEDITRDPGAYGVAIPDPNISHRRVQQLAIFFSRAGASRPQGGDDWRPGDVVIWDLDGSGESLQIGLLSDRRAREGHPLAIHHGRAGDRFSGYPSEGDLLFEWPVLHHFRWPPD